MKLPALAHRWTFVVVAAAGLGALALMGFGWAQEPPPVHSDARIETADRAARRAEARTQALARRVNRLEARLRAEEMRRDRRIRKLWGSMGRLRDAASAAATSAHAAGSAASSAEQRARDAASQAAAAAARAGSVAEDLSVLDQRFDYHLGRGGG